MRYLLDTNVVIDILRDNADVTRQYQLETLKRSRMFICPIVYYEIVRGFKIGGATKKFETFLELYRSWKLLTFDEDAAKKSVDIYEQLHKGKLIEDNDIYIAAISIVNGCTLVTANTNHFGRVDGLNFINWRT